MTTNKILLLTLLAYSRLHAGHQGPPNVLTQQERQDLIDDFLFRPPCCGQVEQNQALFPVGGPWDTTECTCSNCPIKTATCLERNQCTLCFCCCALGTLSVPTCITSTIILESAAQGTCLAKVAALMCIISCPSVTISSPLCCIDLRNIHNNEPLSLFFDKRILEWISNPENWQPAEEAPLLQPPQALAMTEDE